MKKQKEKKKNMVNEKSIIPTCFCCTQLLNQLLMMFMTAG